MAPGATAPMPPEYNSGYISYAFPKRHAKRRRSSTIVAARCLGSDNGRIAHCSSAPLKIRKTTEIFAGDHVKMEMWYRDAFHAVQQVSCRLVAKLWIKRIHLKKQSTHPYNGGYPRDVPRDPERTKPYYWPRDVRHKEPDHITRDGEYLSSLGDLDLITLRTSQSVDERYWEKSVEGDQFS
jgi:hypothetical protein